MSTIPSDEELAAQVELESDGVVWRGAERLRDFLIAIDDVKPFPGNARRGDVPRLIESLKRFGQVRPVLVADDLTIVAGHHVTKAARQLGWTHIAAIPAEFDTRDDARDYLLADNQLSALGYIETVDQLSLLEEVAASGRWEGTGFTPDDLEDMRALQVHKTEMVAAGELKRHERNYRDHSLEQIQHLTKSLQEHGIYRNIVIARDGTILAGHALVQAAQWVGIKKIPATRLDLDPDDPEALKILAGDNELSRFAELDDHTLAEILKRVHNDVSGLLGTGYDPQTLANLIMVSRPRSEIRTVDEAAHWIGLAEYEVTPEPVKLVVQFESEEKRAEFLALINVRTVHKVTLGTKSVWWPDRPRDDLSSLRFDFGEEDDEAIDQTTRDVNAKQAQQEESP